VAVGQNVAEMWRFFVSQDGGRRHLGFLKFENFNSRKSKEVQTASSCQISADRSNGF